MFQLSEEGRFGKDLLPFAEGVRMSSEEKVWREKDTVKKFTLHRGGRY